MNEAEQPKPEIKWPGRLFGEKFDRNIWRGQISARLDVLKDRFGILKDNQASSEGNGVSPEDDKVFRILHELRERAGSFFVKANPAAPVRCIDGRGESDTEADSSMLGPQVPGGTPIMALCWRLASWGQRGKNLEEDLETYLGQTKDLPYRPGAHEDEHNEHHEENTGCGAIDKARVILNVMRQRDVLHPYVQAIAGEHFDEQSFNNIVDRLRQIDKTVDGDTYFMRNESNNVHEFGNKVVGKIKGLGHRIGQKSVEKLSGQHNEVLLIINKAADETFDRDGFAAVTDGKAQAFNYDFWHAVNQANALFPGDEMAQRTMVTANVMYAVATAMVLTDGSLEYGVRS